MRQLLVFNAPSHTRSDASPWHEIMTRSFKRLSRHSRLSDAPPTLPSRAAVPLVAQSRPHPARAEPAEVLWGVLSRVGGARASLPTASRGDGVGGGRSPQAKGTPRAERDAACTRRAGGGAWAGVGEEGSKEIGARRPCVCARVAVCVAVCVTACR